MSMEQRIYGHRGAPAEFPENTLAGFRRAKELGVYGIELDVHLSKDGVAVVCHDETLDRTTDAKGPIADYTVDELRKVEAGDGEYVPTLLEVLELVGDSMHVDIEVKANEAGAAVLDDVKKVPGLRWLVSSFDWDVLRFVRQQDTAADIWVLTMGATEDAIETYHELNAGALAIWQRAMDEDIATFLREEDIPWWPWTVNDPGRARQMFEWGAIGICTDNPAMKVPE
jgi:glycerophosphoryl diester phosphodiesterase